MRGAILGAVLVVFLTEGTRFASDALSGLTPVQTASVREAMIGVALILVLYFRPQGLVPERPRVLNLRQGQDFALDPPKERPD